MQAVSDPKLPSLSSLFSDSDSWSVSSVSYTTQVLAWDEDDSDLSVDARDHDRESLS